MFGKSSRLQYQHFLQPVFHIIVVNCHTDLNNSYNQRTRRGIDCRSSVRYALRIIINMKIWLFSYWVLQSILIFKHLYYRRKIYNNITPVSSEKLKWNRCEDIQHFSVQCISQFDSSYHITVVAQTTYLPKAYFTTWLCIIIFHILIINTINFCYNWIRDFQDMFI